MKEIIDRFKGVRVLVVGDLMLDKYIWGEVSRISPEAPVPVVHVQKETFVPGGAANTAANVTSLGGTCVLAGFIGEDTAGNKLRSELVARQINTDGIIKHGKTIEKVRIIGRSQQLLRVDYEDKCSDHHVKDVVAFAKRLNPDAILISDYNKGFVTKELAESLITLGKRVFVDPKPATINFYKNAFVIKPNREEAEQITGIKDSSDSGIAMVAQKMKEMFNSNIVITRGKDGVTVFDGNHSHIPSQAREVFDVTGAGDTFMAALTLGVCAGASLKDSAKIANIAAGLKVGKIGTATVSSEELKRAV